jgi:membrane protein
MRFVRFQLRLWRFCARRLWEHNLGAMSAALSFRTIFALIPAIVLVALILKSAGVFEDSKESLHRFLEGSGFAQITVAEPAGPENEEANDADTASEKSVNVADEIERIVARVESQLTLRRVGPVGVVLMVWTALTLLTTMERSLNRIFGARQARGLARRITVYWSVLTLGPLALVAAGYAGRRVGAAFESVPGFSWIMDFVGWAGPLIVGILVVAAIYKLLPNTTIRYRAAIGGAVISVPVWLLAKWGFAIYVTKLVGTGNLYGALGLLPLFLIWLNLSWTIFLFGAELAHTAANLASMQAAELAESTVLGPADLLAAALSVAKPYLAGRGPVSREQVVASLRLPEESALWLLDRLSEARVVCPTGDERQPAYALARPAEAIPILAVMGIVDQQPATLPGRSYDPEIGELVRRTCESANSAMGTFTLVDALAAAEARHPANVRVISADVADQPTSTRSHS